MVLLIFAHLTANISEDLVSQCFKIGGMFDGVYMQGWNYQYLNLCLCLYFVFTFVCVVVFVME